MPTNPLVSNLIQLCQLPFLAALLLVGVSGCSLAPSYERPALPVPSAQGLATAAPSAGAGDTALSVDEQSFVNDLSPDGDLAVRVRLALDFNRDLRITALRVQEARSTLRIVQADRLPTLVAGVQRDRQHFADRAMDERYGQDLSAASLGVSDYELDFFGRLKSLSDAARHNYLATSYGQQAARSALIIEVARAYLAEQLAHERLTQARSIDDAQLSLLQRINDQQREGSASNDEVSLQRIEQLRSHQQLQDAIADEARASQAMLFLTGYAKVLPPAKPGTEVIAPDLLATPAWLADLSSTRLLDRFDVRQREESLQAMNANIGAARAAFFPSIKLSTGVGIASDSLGSLFSEGTGAWLFTPQLTLPVFDGGRNRANLDVALVRKNIAVAEYDLTIQAAFRQVADVLAQRRQVLSRVRSESELRSLALEKVRRQTMEFETGNADRSVMLAALIQIAKVNLALRQSKYELLLNRLDIYRVLCGADASPPQSLADTGVSP